ncbi:hypothetical protein EXY25_00465 [Corallincola spongiicola]|uniref:Acyltransferase 3 domain-containing protein n=2 Tax=Corallincola spongiicola TaxID=2520508 RepID=A0ABY1WSN8_9GAMM|nr:hypothetical protein EXY25_00465 [Corallincola spongiicola]
MIIVHLPPYISDAHIPAFFFPIKIVFYDVFGRASVTAMSFVSGFLIYFSLLELSWNKIVVRRFKKLIIPMAFWNFAMIVFSIIVFLFLGRTLPAYENVRALNLHEILFNSIFSLNNLAASGTLSFIRDLFVCSVISTPLAFLIKRFSWFVIAALLIIYLTISFEPIVFRGSIFIFFALGMVVAQEIGHLKVSTLLRCIYVVVICVVFAIEFGLFSEFYMYDLLKRAAIGLFFLDLSFYLMTVLKIRMVDSFSGATYLIYLSHDIAFMILWGVWNIFVGKDITPVYLLFFFLVPLSWFFVVKHLLRIFKFLPAFGQVLIFGKVRG